MPRAGISLLFVLLSTAGCSKEPPPIPPPPPVAGAPVPPAPPLPDLGEVRFRDWSEVDEEKFLELPAPAAPAALKWDFAPGRRYGYDFSESLSQRIEGTAGGKQSLITSREKNRGVFEFAAGRDHSALAMSKIQTQEAFLNDQAIARESFAKRPPSIAEVFVDEDGATQSKSSKGLADARLYFQCLFALRPGERDLAPGKITTKLAGYSKVGRYECARLESEFEIAAEKPVERTLIRGRVLSYFALGERRFIRASAAVANSSRGITPSKDGVWITSSLDALTGCRARFLDSP